MEHNCKYLDVKTIGGIPEADFIQYYYKCQCPYLPIKYDDELNCDNCKYYEAIK